MDGDVEAMIYPTQLKITRKQAWPLVRLAFPEYTGRKFTVEFREQIMFYDTNWSGGTRSVYKFVHIGGAISELIVNAPWANPVEGMRYTMTTGVVVVRYREACGVVMGITIYAHPDYAPKWLGTGAT